MAASCGSSGERRTPAFAVLLAHIGVLGLADAHLLLLRHHDEVRVARDRILRAGGEQGAEREQHKAQGISGAHAGILSFRHPADQSGVPGDGASRTDSGRLHGGEAQ